MTMSATEQLAVSPALAPSPTPVAPRIVPAADALRWAAMGGIFAAFLAAWQWLPAILAIPPYILPPLSDTMAEMARMWAQEDLLANFLSTLSMTILGFLVGGFCGAAGGYLLGMSRFWEQALSPFLLALQIAPKVAFAPLFIMWFGYTAWPKLLVTILVVFFPILVNVLQSMKTVDRDLINLARAYSLNRFQIFLKIELPASMPSLMAGLRIGATLAVIGVTVGELVGGNTGLGYLISYGEGQANAAMVFNAILLLTAIGIALYAAVAAVEKRVLHYIPRARS
ncbi:ABC transporter permease [Roseomonas sp. FDAARGOS_362]|uniref:ABC transporter permease n=2 Tax=Roseomonas mucosa TaxID=207340 RepID=A0A1S8D2Z3_9PROT|nr:ABC transporter permease [Roseomonas sp. FDAARGOS_362]ONH81815.1 ABC transporter permease [Roseomonas mucosa]